MKISIGLVFVTAFLEVLSECLLEFDSDEKECVVAFKYPVEKIVKYYNKGYPEEEENNFNLFVECLWHKRKFLDQKGNIKYNAIKNTNREYFFITGICDEVPLNTSERTKLYQEAVEQCEREARADYRAETARSCIARNYKRRLPIVEKEDRKEEGKNKNNQEKKKK